MNFLISEGHIFASRYPVGKVWSEAEIIRRRENENLASQATIDHTVHAAIHGGKEGHSRFKRLVKKLTGA